MLHWIRRVFVVFCSSFLQRKMQLKFKDRTAAGNLLAQILQDKIRRLNRHKQDPAELLVLGIPRGGAIIAYEVAKILSAAMDLVVTRRLPAPHSEELGIGAIMEDGTSYINHQLVSLLSISRRYIDAEKTSAINEIRRKNALYQKRNVQLKPNIKDKMIILVDDGAASGATIFVALKWIRKYKPRFIIVGLPIGPRETVDLLRKEADMVECILVPENNKFRSVEQFYSEFKQVPDTIVSDIMRKSGHL